MKGVLKDLPGYSGYIWALKPENFHGNTYSHITRTIRSDPSLRGNRELTEQQPTISLYTDSYGPNKLEKLGHNIQHWTKINKKPVKNSDEFPFRVEVPPVSSPKNSRKVSENRWEDTKPLGEPIVGYRGFRPKIQAENLHAENFSRMFRISKSTTQNRNEPKSLPLPLPTQTAFHQPEIKSYGRESITGYRGFRPRVYAGNIFGKPFAETQNEISESIAKENHYNALKRQTGPVV